MQRRALTALEKQQICRKRKDPEFANETLARYVNAKYTMSSLYYLNAFHLTLYHMLDIPISRSIQQLAIFDISKHHFNSEFKQPVCNQPLFHAHKFPTLFVPIVFTISPKLYSLFLCSLSFVYQDPHLAFSPTPLKRKSAQIKSAQFSLQPKIFVCCVPSKFYSLRYTL